MSNPVWTTAAIGGTIKRSQLDQLAEAIELEMEPEDMVGDTVAETLELAADVPECAIFQGHCPHGRAGNLGQRMTELGLTCRLSHETGGDFEAEICLTAPGLPENGIRCRGGQDGEPAITLVDLRGYEDLETAVAELERLDAVKTPDLVIQDG